MLVKVRYEGKIEWLLVNLRDIASSLNLTKTFGMSFEQIEMIDNSANQLFVLENHQLRRINVSGADDVARVARKCCKIRE